MTAARTIGKIFVSPARGWQKLAERSADLPESAPVMTAFVYVIASHDGKGWRSYVGWTTDVLRRLGEHNGTRRGAKSTRGRDWQLVHVEAFAAKTDAMRREWFLKRDRAARKRMLAGLPPAVDRREGQAALEMPLRTASLPPVTTAEDAMKAKALIVAALALAACAAPEDEGARGVHAGAWPMLGQAVGTLGGTEAAWNTYDFSRGAYDASVIIEGRKLTLTGFPPGAPEAQDGLLRVTAPVLDLSRDGITLGPAFVSVVDSRNWDHPRLRDVSGTVNVIDFSTEQDISTSGYGRIKGSVTAQLCSETGGDCQPLVLSFDTRLQITP